MSDERKVNSEETGLRRDHADSSIIEATIIKEVQRRYEAQRNWAIGLFTVAAIVVTAFGGSVLRVIAEDAVNVALERSAGLIELEYQSAFLHYRATRMEEDNYFNVEEANSMIDELQSLYPKYRDAERPEGLVVAAETIVKNAAAADRLDIIDRLQTAVPDIAANSEIFLQAVLNARGYWLIAAAGAPRSWLEADGPMREMHQNYALFAGKAWSGGYPELYLFFEVNLRHLEERPMEEIVNLVEDIDDLDDVRAGRFRTILVSYLTEGIVVRSTAESRRAAARVREFLCIYKDNSNLLSNIYEEHKMNCDAADFSAAGQNR